MSHNAKNMALGGVMAALAVVIMAMGGLIPLATYICPMLCMLMLKLVLEITGGRVAWAWYGAVALLGLLLGPDKEAAAVFVALGWYPILKPRLDRMPLGIVWKLALFNGSILGMYWVLMHLLGMVSLAAEFEEMGAALTAATLILGNVTFFLLDRILSMKRKGSSRG